MLKRIGRYIFFLGPMLISYVLFLISFFGGSLKLPFLSSVSPLFLMIFLLVIFLFFLNLSLPDLKKLGITTWQRFFLLSFFCLLLILRGKDGVLDIHHFFYVHGFQLLAGVFLVMGISFLLRTKESTMENRVVIYTRPLHYAGVFMFSLFISLSFAFYSFGTFKSLPFSCEELQESQDDVFGLINAPLRTSNELFQGIRGKMTTFLETDVIDVLESWLTIDALQNPGGGSFFQEVKNTLLQEAIEEKRTVDETICEFVSQLISEKRNKAGLQYSVIFLIFLLIYPVLGLICIVSAVISFLLFSVLKKMGVRTISESMKLVQEIE